MAQDNNHSQFDRLTYFADLEKEVMEVFKGVNLPQDRIRKLTRFGTLLVETSQTLNLTRILDPKGVAIRHFLDSSYLLPALKKVKGTVIDIGTGGGVPGIPLAIMRRDLKIVMLDGTKKKIDFINRAIQELDLKNARAVHGRMEEHLRYFQFGAGLFRASLKPEKTFEILQDTGQSLSKLVFMEGKNGPDRAKAVRQRAKRAGYKLDQIFPYRLPGMDNKRHIVCFKRA